MAKTKSAPKKAKQEDTFINKIAGQVGHLAGELAAGKNHLIEMAGDAIESVKSTLHNITTKKKAVPKKRGKPTAKKAMAKTAVPLTQKLSTASATKKTTPPTKSPKKAVRKVSAKSKSNK